MEEKNIAVTTRRPRPRRTPKDQMVDRHVGAMVRHYRIMKGISQQRMAEVLNLTFQQIQKYETGGNRMSPSALFYVAKYLGVAPSTFFEGLEQDGDVSPIHDIENDMEVMASINGVPQRRETMELIRAVESITDSGHRQALIDMVYAISETETADIVN